MFQIIDITQRECRVFCNQFKDLPSPLQAQVIGKTIFVATLVGLGTAFVFGSIFAPITFSVTAIYVSKSAVNNHFIIKKTETLQTPQAIGNATALEFISSINPKLFAALTPLTEKEAQEFLNRGGSLNIIREENTENKIALRKDEPVITGCNSGVNRSQVAAAAIINNGITVKGVLAGGDSAMNQEADYPLFADPLEIGEENYSSATNFKRAFGMSKFNQVGLKETEKKEVSKAKEFYQDYIDRLSPTHFITFSTSGPSVLKRLLARKGSLDGFTITHFPWGDEIAHPPEGYVKYSVKTYKLFAQKLIDRFIFTR